MGECGPGAYEFIERIFHDCIYSRRDLVGFCLGLGSIGMWACAQVPQLVKNYRTQSSEALSPWFLAQWLLVRRLGRPATARAARAARAGVSNSGSHRSTVRCPSPAAAPRPLLA